MAVLPPYEAAVISGVFGATMNLSKHSLAYISGDAKLSKSWIPLACSLLTSVTAYAAMQLIPNAKAVAVYSLASLILIKALDFCKPKLDMILLRNTNNLEKQNALTRNISKNFFIFLYSNYYDLYTTLKESITDTRPLPSALTTQDKCTEKDFEKAQNEARYWSYERTIVKDYLAQEEHAKLTLSIIQSMHKDGEMNKSEVAEIMGYYSLDEIQKAASSHEKPPGFVSSFKTLINF